MLNSTVMVRGIVVDLTQQRLIALCKLWGIVKYFHPYLAYRAIDWDGALVAAIPKVKAAADEHGFAEAVGGMLAALGDPATCIVKREPDREASEENPVPFADLREDGVLLVDMTNYRALESTDTAMSRLNEIQQKLAEAKAVVFDLRVRVPSNQDEWLAYLLDSAMPQLLCCDDVVAPGERTREHTGFPSQSHMPNNYRSAFKVTDAQRFAQFDDAQRIQAVFVVDRRSLVPAAVLALQDAGHAAIVAEEGWDDRRLVKLHTVDLGGENSAQIRLGELLRADGSVGVRANIVVPASAKGVADTALETAIGLARNFAPPPAHLERPAAAAAPQREPDYPAMTYPAAEYRLLALFRIHNVIEYFFPYKDLMEDWDAVTAAFIPRFETAADAVEYNLAVAEILTHTHDSHVAARSAVLDEHIGEAAPGVRLSWIEGSAVIAALPDAEAAGKAGAAIGDIVLSVDGEAVGTRMARIGRYQTASTPQSHRAIILRQLLRGPRDSELQMTLRDANGQEKEVRLRRTLTARSQSAPRREGEIARWLPGNIAYADLDRLEQSEVDGMFEKFAGAKAMIFDMRGYPNGTAWSIAPRLSKRPQPIAARFERPRVFAPLSMHDDMTWQPGRDVFLQTFPLARGPRYAGLTLMLIDERAISQSEHTGLFFKAANGTVLVGSPTAGANGDVTSFVLPGKITVSFTGQAVMHPDGARLQRVGLLPDVEVRPTIQSLREGRDEVLEAAIAYIERTVK